MGFVCFQFVPVRELILPNGDGAEDSSLFKLEERGARCSGPFSAPPPLRLFTIRHSGAIHSPDCGYSYSGTAGSGRIHLALVLGGGDRYGFEVPVFITPGGEK